MKWVILAVLIGIVGFCLLPIFHEGCSRWKAFRTLPAERDPRLIGVWKVKRDGNTTLYEFQPDGTGIRAYEKLSQISTRLKWGTKDGRLTLSWPSIDSGPRYGEAEYRISADGRSLTFEPSKSGFPLTTMERVSEVQEK